jgi:hypothetical protein
MTRTDALALAMAFLAGCDTSAVRDAPRPGAITPAIGFATADAIVEIRGDDFHVEGVQSADEGGSSVDASYRAWLGATELRDVTWIDTGTLRALVPQGLPLGPYDLTVEGPYGRGTLPSAYQVIEGTLGSLGISLSSPLQVAVGEELQVNIQAINTGTWPVQGVVPDVAISVAGVVDPITVSTAAQNIEVGQARTFTFRYRAIKMGAITLNASVAGIDPRNGVPITASTSTQVALSAPLKVQVIADDPFADRSPFAFVVEHGGQVYVGPNHTGVGIIRMQPDGSQAQSLALSFPRDTIGNQSLNSSAPPYTSIGYTGCPTNTSSGCGPDNEDGRGFLASVSFMGESWLVLGGARSGGDLDYVYMTRSTTSPLAFSYVDLSLALGGNTRGFSAALGVGDRLYLGFPDNGGERPYGVVLLAAPPWPGLDASSGSDVKNFDLHGAYDDTYAKTGEATFAPISMVDTIAEMNGRIYIFNDLGCLVSKSSTPNSKGDFDACSPPVLGLAYTQSESIDPTKQYDLAWPAAVAWNGRLYAIRNTSTGPQLWSCDPAGGADPAVCDRTDWRLVAADGNLRTRFGKAGTSAATLLLATPTHLYVGFDDAAFGAHLFRTGFPVPTVPSDFSGKDGCVAGTNGCEGIGGDGFGFGLALSRIFDAKAVALGDGSFEVVLTTGNGTDPVRVVRIAPP